MKITKAAVTVNGDEVRLSMPISKANKATRIVSGWATLNNLDTQKDEVPAEANKRAFSRFRGNIREMHQPVAVGRMVKFKEDRFYDDESKAWYDGIWVDVYVSKGAESTWEKVLDGTLTGFSIGGNILDYDTRIDKASGGPVRVVKDYELVELSLVDSPANQLANIMSIHKTATGTFVDGAVASISSESVFYCKHDGVAKTSNDEEVECPEGHKMENIGLVEYADEDSKTEKVAEVLAEYKTSHETAEQEDPATTEGGVDVAEEKVVEVEATKTVEETVTAPGEEGKAETEVASSVEEVEHTHAEGEEHDEVEKAADVSEVEVEEPDFAKVAATLESLKGIFETGLEKTRSDITAEVTKATETFTAKTTELEYGQAELNKRIDGLVEQLTEVKKSAEAAVTKADGKTAVKKSADLGGSAEVTVEKSTGSGKDWGGTFLPVGGKRFLSVNSLEEN